MMKYARKIRRRNYVLLALFMGIYFFASTCTSSDPSPDTAIRNSEGKLFAVQGSVACSFCHKNIYQHHISTAHYRDSRPALAAYIKGSFDSGRNRFVYNRSTEVVMEHKGNGFFQTAFIDGKEYRSEPFDIVIGSGKKGQTYLYYGSDGKLFQLPVSFSTSDASWCNSPGYYPDSVRFNRPVNAYCLECHATQAGPRTGAQDDADLIDKDRIIYGIDCEKCHGPGAEHVSYHRTHPGEQKARYIVDAKLLSRQQRLDACASCHSGLRVPLRPAFSFRVGDTLNKFSQPGFASGNAGRPEVHGNQYGLLLSSKCFQHSQMDCSSCHDVHMNEAGNPKLFSQRCMSCHTQAAHNTCTLPTSTGLVLGDNCIDCHMPALPSQKIALQPSGISQEMLSGLSKATPTLVRTHRIAVYPENTKKYLEKLKAR